MLYSRRCWTTLLQIMENLDISVVQNSNEFENKRIHNVSLCMDRWIGGVGQILESIKEAKLDRH
jgi:hypothetical protein